MGKDILPAGNRTPVSCVTGGDTHQYTTEDKYKLTTTQIASGSGYNWIRVRAVSCFKCMVNDDNVVHEQVALHPRPLQAIKEERKVRFKYGSKTSHINLRVG